jgi:hypothetical protein
MQYESVDPSKCTSYIHTPGHKLPLSAANSMNFLASCLADSSSWVSKNYLMYNVLDSLCSWGYDETCSVDLTISNQPKCAHTLGNPVTLSGNPVYNIRYPSGQKVLATTGQVAAPSFGARLRLPERRELVFLVTSVGALVHFWSGL